MSFLGKIKVRTNLFSIIILTLFVLSACTSNAPAAQPAKASSCSEAGTIGREKIPHPSQGFNISFQYYLPPCYSASKTTRFPVIYLITMPFESRLDYQDNTPMSLADRLIHAGKMPPAILVVPDDLIDFGFNTALAIDLFPFVDNKFRTLPERQYRGIGGISHGGAIAARMAFQFPQVFGNLGVFSGGIASGEKGGFEDWINSNSSGIWPHIWIDVGNQDTGILPLTENLVDVLHQNRIDYSLDIEPGDHNWSFWSPRMGPYLLWFAEAWK